MAEQRESVLEFEGVCLQLPTETESRRAPLSFTLRAGELAFFPAPSGGLEYPVAKAARGMLHPLDGKVRYLGVDWERASVRERHAARATIGSVHDGTEWVSNLNVDENLLLKACHHSRRPESEIVEEALTLARKFGLSELTSRRSHLVARRELRAYALVRAFLGSPRLLVLNRPLRGVFTVYFKPLLALIEGARAGGCAVLWISSEKGVTEATDLLQDSIVLSEPSALRAQEGAAS